ncbi:MAG: glycine betaine/L-proline ABC transporter substrate-binding protein ProX [Arenicella sp.]
MINIPSLKSFRTLFNSVLVLLLLTIDVLANEKTPGKGITVKPVISGTLDDRFRSEIAMAGLRELGYKIDGVTEANYEKIMPAIIAGKGDFSVDVWNKMHNKIYVDNGGKSKLTKGELIIPYVAQGYVIDKKTAKKFNITQLSDFKKKEIAKLFDNNGDGKADLVGCNTGWRCRKVIDHHLKAYGLENTIDHNTSGYFKLLDKSIERYKEGKPILYFAWAPWSVALLVPGRDVVWLEVPFTSLPNGETNVNTVIDGVNVGFIVDQIVTVMGRDFALENKAAAKFLSLLQIPESDESIQNLKVRNGERTLKDIKRHAKDWIQINRNKFDAWLDQARSI